MKRALGILLSLICFVAGAQTPAGKQRDSHLSIAAGGRFNHVLNNGHHNIYGRLLDSYDSPGAEIQLGIDTHPADSSWWAEAFNYPHFAVGFSWNNESSLRFKNNSRLGDFYNLYAKAQIDVLRAGFFSFGPFLEVGAAYTPERYHYYSNPANKEIGTNIVGLLGAGLDLKFRILPQWELSMAAALTHHSNGMTGVPNIGLNELSAVARVKYYMAPPPPIVKVHPSKPEYPHGFHLGFQLSAGVHACDTERRANEETGNVTDNSAAVPRFRGFAAIEATYRYAPVFSSGGGVEFSYAANRYRETDMALEGRTDPNGYSPFYVALYLVQEFHYSNLSLHVMYGVYVFKKTGLTEDMPNTFQRIGLRYQVPRAGGLYFAFDMHAHSFDRSYCLEPGIGYRF